MEKPAQKSDTSHSGYHRSFGYYGYGYHAPKEYVTVEFTDEPLTGPAPFLGDIQRNIKSSLVPEDVYLVPYKINVYGPGGKFLKHVDTPIFDAAKMLGSVVVALPTAFTGGALHVHGPSGGAAEGEKSKALARFEWGQPEESPAAAKAAKPGKAAKGKATGKAKAKAAKPAAGNLKWAAFFSDCVHEVQPVTSGYRVTVTYAIMAGTQPVKFSPHGRLGYAPFEVGTPKRTTSAAAGLRYLNPLIAKLRECKEKTLGFVLTHKYTFTGVEAGALKGVDKVLHDGLVRAGFRVAVRPVVYDANVQGSYPGSGEKGTAINTVYSFTADDLAALRQCKRSKTDAMDIPFIRCSISGNGRVSGDSLLGIMLEVRYCVGYVEWAKVPIPTIFRAAPLYGRSGVYGQRGPGGGGYVAVLFGRAGGREGCEGCKGGQARQEGRRQAGQGQGQVEEVTRQDAQPKCGLNEVGRVS